MMAKRLTLKQCRLIADEQPWVIYCPEGGPREDGRIIRCSDYGVFVLYRGDTTPKLTDPALLELGCPSVWAERLAQAGGGPW